MSTTTNRDRLIKRQQSIEQARWGYLETPAFMRAKADKGDIVTSPGVSYEEYKADQVARMQLEADDVTDVL